MISFHYLDVRTFPFGLEIFIHPLFAMSKVLLLLLFLCFVSAVTGNQKSIFVVKCIEAQTPRCLEGIEPISFNMEYLSVPKILSVGNTLYSCH